MLLSPVMIALVVNEEPAGDDPEAGGALAPLPAGGVTTLGGAAGVAELPGGLPLAPAPAAPALPKALATATGSEARPVLKLPSLVLVVNKRSPGVTTVIDGPEAPAPFGAPDMPGGGTPGG